MVLGSVGAMVDDRYAGPITLEGKVLAIREGDVHAQIEVVVQVGSIKVIVTQKRKPYHYEIDFTQLGLNPRKTEILVVKIGYLVPELYNIRGGWTMALTPGGVDQNLERLDYQRIKRPMFPLDKEFPLPGYLEKQVLDLTSQKLLNSYFSIKTDMTADGSFLRLPVALVPFFQKPTNQIRTHDITENN